MYNGMLATKNNEILEKDKYSITYTQNLKKNDTNKSIYKIETDSQTQKTNLWLPMGKGRGGRDKLGAWG